MPLMDACYRVGHVGQGTSGLVLLLVWTCWQTCVSYCFILFPCPTIMFKELVLVLGMLNLLVRCALEEIGHKKTANLS